MTEYRRWARVSSSKQRGHLFRGLHAWSPEPGPGGRGGGERANLGPISNSTVWKGRRVLRMECALCHVRKLRYFLVHKGGFVGLFTGIWQDLSCVTLITIY